MAFRWRADDDLPLSIPVFSLVVIFKFGGGWGSGPPVHPLDPRMDVAKALNILYHGQARLSHRCLHMREVSKSHELA